MLVLTRKVGETIKIGDDIYIRVVQLKGKQVRIGVEAPADMKVQREELNIKTDHVTSSKSQNKSSNSNSDTAHLKDH